MLSLTSLETSSPSRGYATTTAERGSAIFHASQFSTAQIIEKAKSAPRSSSSVPVNCEVNTRKTTSPYNNFSVPSNYPSPFHSSRSISRRTIRLHLPTRETSEFEEMETKRDKIREDTRFVSFVHLPVPERRVRVLRHLHDHRRRRRGRQQLLLIPVIRRRRLVAHFRHVAVHPVHPVHPDSLRTTLTLFPKLPNVELDSHSCDSTVGSFHSHPPIPRILSSNFFPLLARLRDQRSSAI